MVIRAKGWSIEKAVTFWNRKPGENLSKKKPKDDEEGDIDSDREKQNERNFDRIQRSIETGGDE